MVSAKVAYSMEIVKKATFTVNIQGLTVPKFELERDLKLYLPHKVYS